VKRAGDVAVRCFLHEPSPKGEGDA
jgi:hypothetical protein